MPYYRTGRYVKRNTRYGSNASNTYRKRGAGTYSRGSYVRKPYAKRFGGAKRSGRSTSSSYTKDLTLCRSREFLWGDITVSYTAGAITGIALNTPDGTGGTAVTAFAVSGTHYTAGLSQEFTLNDMPATFSAFVKQFEQYKIDKVNSSHCSTFTCL